MQMTRQKLVVFLAVLVDVLGFGIVIPILPFYVSEFGVSAFTITLMFSSFSFFSFLSAPFLGALSDRIGRRPVMILSITSTAIGWLVFASARSVWVLFLGRIIDGAAAGNFTTAQSTMVDISRDEKERAQNLGMVGAIFGIGFILGPVIGGVLSRVSHSFPFYFAGLMAAANAVTAYFLLPETNAHRDPHRPMNFNPLSPLLRAAKDSRMRPLYVTWSFFAFAIVTGQSVFALFVRDTFGFDAFHTGMAFTGVGVIVLLNQTVLLKKFWLARFSEKSIEVIALVILALGGLCFATEMLPLFFTGMLGLGTGQAVLRVVITSRATEATDPSKKGETIGILAALMSAYMVVAPGLSGYLYELHHTLPFVVSSALLFFAVYFAVKNA